MEVSEREGMTLRFSPGISGRKEEDQKEKALQGKNLGKLQAVGRQSIRAGKRPA